MPETPNHAEEAEMMAAVKQAMELCDTGLSPDAALEKVARARGYGPGKIQIAGYALNNGRQVAQWNGPGSVLDKLAAYPLCDPDAVVRRIYDGPTPAEKAAADAVGAEYRRPPTFLRDAGREKAASYQLPVSRPEPYKPDPAEAVMKAFAAVEREKTAADECRRQARAAEDGVRAKVAQLIGYFKQAAYNRLPFETVEQATRTYYGQPGVALLNLVHAQGRLPEKRASGPILEARPIDLRAEPFTLIKAALDQAAACHSLREKAASAKQKAAAVKTEALRPFTKAGEATQPAETGPWSTQAAAVFGTEKRAFGFGTEVAAIASGDILAHKATHGAEDDDPYGDVADLNEQTAAVRRAAGLKLRKRGMRKKAFLNTPAVGAAIGTMLGRTVGPVGKTKDDLVEDAWMDLEDPEHANELRKIRSHAMLNQLMTDPDDPISGHSHDKVLKAYNEIAASAPRVADTIATLRPLLRKKLESHQEPFESKEMLDTEKTLAQTRMPTPNTSLLSETPDKILG